MGIELKTPSLYKIISLVLVLLCFVMMFLPWVTARVSGMGMNESESFNLFTINKDAFEGDSCFWLVMLKICMFLFFPAILAAIFGNLTDRPGFVLPAAALALLMFLFDMFTCFWAKGKVDEMLSGYGSYMSDLGVSYGFHVGAGCWLFLFLGLGAFGVLLFERRSGGAPVKSLSLPHRSRGGWTCPGCGAALGAEEIFCSNCGSRKPMPPRCPACGHVGRIGAGFCSNCGTRLSE